MKIDFNSVRKHAVGDLSKLIDKLNSANEGGTIRIDADYIDRDLQNLRSSVCAIAITYVPGDDDFKDVLGDRKVPCFNRDRND